jgi:hypothetical protein
MTLDFSASSFPPDLISGFAAEAQNPPAGKPSLWCQLCLRPAAHEPRLIIGPAPPFHPRTSPQPPPIKELLHSGTSSSPPSLCSFMHDHAMDTFTYHRLPSRRATA